MFQGHIHHMVYESSSSQTKSECILHFITVGTEPCFFFPLKMPVASYSLSKFHDKKTNRNGPEKLKTKSLHFEFFLQYHRVNIVLSYEWFPPKWVQRLYHWDSGSWKLCRVPFKAMYPQEWSCLFQKPGTNSVSSCFLSNCDLVHLQKGSILWEVTFLSNRYLVNSVAFHIIREEDQVCFYQIVPNPWTVAGLIVE